MEHEIVTGPEMFQRAVETQELMRACMELEKGHVLPNSRIVELCGRQSIGECHSFCQGAVRGLEKEGSLFVFHPKKRGGIYRLQDHEQVERSEGLTKQMSKRAKRERKRNATIDTSNLSQDQVRDMLTTEAQLGALQLIGQKNTRKRIASEVKDQPLQISETLRLFVSKEDTNGSVTPD
jgi:hypothetical protein